MGTLTGPPFFAALANVVGTNNLAVQGVDYPASVQGFLAGGDANSSSTLMAQLVSQATSQCPNSKVVVSGYSQGGQLVHNVAKVLNASTAAAVSSGMTLSSSSYGYFKWHWADAIWMRNGYLRRPKQRYGCLRHLCCEDAGYLPHWGQYLPAW